MEVKILTFSGLGDIRSLNLQRLVVWGPYHIKELNSLERVQIRATDRNPALLDKERLGLLDIYLP